MQPRLTFRAGELRQISKKVAAIADRRWADTSDWEKSKVLPGPEGALHPSSCVNARACRCGGSLGDVPGLY